jgi:hypothetical protein
MTATQSMIEAVEANNLAIKNAMAAFDRVAESLGLAKTHLSNMCSTFEGRFDARQHFDYSEMEEYVEAAKFLRRFGREGDRIASVEMKMAEAII